MLGMWGAPLYEARALRVLSVRFHFALVLLALRPDSRVLSPQIIADGRGHRAVSFGVSMPSCVRHIIAAGLCALIHDVPVVPP